MPDLNTGGEQGENAAEPDTSGCPDHPRADGDCGACLTKWGLTFETPNRHTLLHPNVLRQRFRPGQSGNPSGRAKGRTMEEHVRAILDEEVVIPGRDEPVEKREALARVVVGEALNSRPKRWAVELLFDRIWPKRVDHDVNNRGAVTVVFDDQDRRELEGPDDGD